MDYTFFMMIFYDVFPMVSMCLFTNHIQNSISYLVCSHQSTEFHLSPVCFGILQRPNQPGLVLKGIFTMLKVDKAVSNDFSIFPSLVRQADHKSASSRQLDGLEQGRIQDSNKAGR